MSPALNKTRSHTRVSLFKSNANSKAKPGKKTMLIPAANVDETATEYLLTIAAPGFDKNTLQVNIDKNNISITAHKDLPQKGYDHDRCEYDYSRWKRVFPLPEDADGLMTMASCQNGELTIRIPKVEKNRQLFTIPVYVY